MSLKELTKDKHTAAENTKFMRAVFKKQLPLHLWTDWLKQKHLFYTTIETAALNHGLLKNISTICRSELLLSDYNTMSEKLNYVCEYKPIVQNYNNYLLTQANNPDHVLAHLYTWHMGDLFGGQQIKNLVKSSHKSLEFDNSAQLITSVRSLLKDELAIEVCNAFDWAILMLKEYDKHLD
jgi:heme oxygenase